MAIPPALIQAGVQLFSAIAPTLIQSFMGLKGSGSQTGSNNQTQSSSQTTQGSMSQSGESSGTSGQMGSVGGIAGLLQQAMGTATGSNWQQAFNASQGSATTANNMQTAQWGIANGLNMLSNLSANFGNLLSSSSAKSYNSK